jgi:hypothetical protein
MIGTDYGRITIISIEFLETIEKKGFFLVKCCNGDRVP